MTTIIVTVLAIAMAPTTTRMEMHNYLGLGIMYRKSICGFSFNIHYATAHADSLLCTLTLDKGCCKRHVHLVEESPR